ncbi:MAG: hypothetical protein AAGU12_16485, partial [Clostridiales bacterium]
FPSDSASRRTPLSLANSSYCQVCSGLSPPSYTPMPGAHKKTEAHDFVNFCPIKLFIELHHIILIYYFDSLFCLRLLPPPSFMPDVFFSIPQHLVCCQCKEQELRVHCRCIYEKGDIRCSNTQVLDLVASKTGMHKNRGSARFWPGFCDAAAEYIHFPNGHANIYGIDIPEYAYSRFRLMHYLDFCAVRSANWPTTKSLQFCTFPSDHFKFFSFIRNLLS